MRGFCHAAQQRIANVDQRCAGTDIAQDVLGQPLQADHATSEHLVRRIGYTDGVRWDSLGKKVFGLLESRGEPTLGFGALGGIWRIHASWTELVPIPLQCVDVDPTQRVQLF